MLTTVRAEERRDLLVQVLHLSIGLRVVARGETHIDAQTLAHLAPHNKVNWGARSDTQISDIPYYSSFLYTCIDNKANLSVCLSCLSELCGALLVEGL